MGNQRPQYASDVITEPENWNEIKKKYLEREEDNLKMVLAHRNAETKQELALLASQSIVARSLRGDPEYKPLKDRTIIREPKSEDIQNLKKKLNEEITAIGQRILHELPSQLPTLEGKIIGLKQLRGRITHSKDKDNSRNAVVENDAGK